MSWQFTPYALLPLMTALVSGGLALYAARRYGMPGARMGALFMVAVSLWALADAIGLCATDLAGKVLWSEISYLGIVGTPLAWFGFAVAYTGRERWLSPRNLALLAIVPALTLALVLTNETHHLFWSETGIDSSGGFVAMTVDHGVGFWIWAGYSYLLLLAGAVFVLTMLARSGSLYSKQGAMLLVGVSAPWVGNVLYLSGMSPIPHLDLTPIFLLVTGIAMTLAITRFRLLDIVPVARYAVVEEMQDGVIVLDARDRVLDMNPAARWLSNLHASKAIGLPVEQVVSNEDILRLVQGGAGETGGQIKTGDGPARRDYEVTLSPLRRSSTRQEVRFIVVRDVTERAEKDLLFRLVADNSSDIVSIYDPSGDFRYVSPSAERVLGYGPGEAMKLGNDPGIIHPEDQPWVWKRREEIWVRPGVSEPLVFRVLHKDGSWRHVEGVFNNLLDHPRIGAVVASWRDVTERVEAEEEVRRLNGMLQRRVIERTAELEKTLSDLSESETRYRTIFEGAVEGIFQTTADGRMVTANPAMARIFGYETPEEFISSVADTAETLYADPRRRMEIAHRIRREGSISGVEARILRRDGSEGWMSVSARAIRDATGELIGYEGTIQDITERAEARRTLERRIAALTGIAASLNVNQPLKATLDSLASGVVETTAALACSVYLIDPKTKVLTRIGLSGLPDVYAEMARASWSGGRWSPARSVFDSQSPVLLRDARRLLLDDPSYEPIYHLVREAAWDVVHISALVARGESLGAISAYYPRDEEPDEGEITFLKAVADQAAIAVQNARFYSAAQGAAALQERQRLSRELHDSVSQALYGIALGSRTARTLLDRDPARVAEPLDYVLSLADAGLAEMRALIFELRPEALESEGLVAALEKQAAAMLARYEIPVSLELSEASDLPPEAREVLYRVAQEALHNTVKHARAGSAEITLRRGPNNVSLVIRDDGIGFDPTGSFPGHLGLSSMRERAEHLGGALKIESAPGEGTQVSVSLPI